LKDKTNKDISENTRSHNKNKLFLCRHKYMYLNQIRNMKGVRQTKEILDGATVGEQAS
jgi:hypothetical protein